MLRKFARQFQHISVDDTLNLLCSAFHEERMLALILLTDKFKKAAQREKAFIYRQYLNHTRHINNWDLGDVSAPHIVGAYLMDQDRTPLYELAASENLWERRIAMVSTFHFIRQGQFTDTLAIAEILLHDGHDLIQKAVGWMLREVGKRNMDTEEAFLKKHYHHMPRTMLRYAIEKFPEPTRKKYLNGEI